MAKKRSEQYLLDAATDITSRSAYEAESIGYIPRFMANASLPTSRQSGNEYTRQNGRYKLHLISPNDIGLPYGSYPRQVLIYLTTQAKLTSSSEIKLGSSQASFLKFMGIHSSGGKTGTSVSFREQFKRLLACTILWVSSDDASWNVESMRISNNATLIWEPVRLTKWKAYLKLDESFFKDIIENAVPIDLRVINSCSYFPLAIDVYCWLTYRYYQMSAIQMITWEQLANQFGNNYSREVNFKNQFIKALERISLLYPAAKFSTTEVGILLYPSKSHVPVKISKKLLMSVDNSVNNQCYPRIKGDAFVHKR
ncbi:replication protein RepA [Methylophaga sp.]|uniref:replication protein RepA n=1 Tax=Methylophaga sp. TaxID=2024840 RepID=UPI003A8D90F2